MIPLIKIILIPVLFIVIALLLSYKPSKSDYEQPHSHDWEE